MNQRELFLRHVAQTSDTPLSGFDLDIVRAHGCTLTARDGKDYLDLISGISVSSVGHCHPDVIKAIRDQSEKFMHLMVFGEFNQGPQVEYATRLCALLPPALQSVYFTTGGSEAVEGALKLAKRFSRRTELVCFRHSYHGSTHGALSVMGDEFFKNSYRPLLPDIQTLAFNNPADLEKISSRTAGVIVEPVQAEAGVRPATKAFLQKLRQKCSETGALLIFDEIQTGLGRTGSLFCFEQYHVVPDILLLAKAMGGGLPIGAFISSQKIMAGLMNDPVLGHINTFGGNALCVKAAEATLEVITKNNLHKNALEIESTVRSELKHPSIKELRMVGALGAIDFGDEALNLGVIRECLKRGLVTDWFLFCPTAMRIAPPLVISQEELRQACKKILEAIDAALEESR